MIINFTGQPESDKTTLSQLLRRELEWYYPGSKVVVLDGDIIRKVTKNYDYSSVGRTANIANAYSIAKALVQAAAIDENFKVFVILAIISPYRVLREKLKQQEKVLEFYLHSTRNSRAQNNVPDYEPPLENFYDIDTDKYDTQCIREIMRQVRTAMIDQPQKIDTVA